jgi:hypothetical protein
MILPDAPLATDTPLSPTKKRTLFSRLPLSEPTIKGRREKERKKERQKARDDEVCEYFFFFFRLLIFDIETEYLRLLILLIDYQLDKNH